jgi:hypothetical protein
MAQGVLLVQTDDSKLSGLPGNLFGFEYPLALKPPVELVFPAQFLYCPSPAVNDILRRFRLFCPIRDDKNPTLVLTDSSPSCE